MSSESWEGRSIEDWRREWGLPRLLVLDQVESTNDVARELADAGAPAGTLVLAEHQTRGRGQRGREWQAPPGRALLMSMVLRARAGAGASPGVLPVRAGLAAAGALDALGARVGLKWPNDLVAGTSSGGAGKLGGILCEASFAGDELVAVVGIGLNVLQAPSELPPGLEPPALSLATLGLEVPRAAVAGAIAGALAALGPDAARPLSDAELREFATRDILRDREVSVDGVPAGVAVGLLADGALLLDAPHDRPDRPDRPGLREIRGGTVRPLDGSYATLTARP